MAKYRKSVPCTIIGLCFLSVFEFGVKGEIVKVEGDSAVLSRGQSKPANITWYKLSDSQPTTLTNHKTVVHSSDRDNAEGQWMNGATVRENGDLSITALSITRDQGEFQCESKTPQRSLMEVRVIVLRRVTHVSIKESTQSELTLSANTVKTVTCAVDNEDSYRYLTYEWSLDQHPPLPTTRTLRLTVQSSDNRKELKCVVTNAYKGTHTTADTKVTLNVLYLGDPVPTPSTIIVSYYEQVEITCAARGNPAPSVQWFRNNHLYTSLQRLWFPQAQLGIRGNYTCRASNSQGVKEATATVFVKHSPIVKILYNNTTNQMTCIPDGYPNIYNFSAWKHVYDQTEIRTIEGQMDSSGQRSFIQLINPTYEDTGQYICEVSNGLGPKMSNRVFVRPKSSPIFSTTNILRYRNSTNFNGKIPVAFYAQPSAQKIRWNRVDDGEVLDTHHEMSGLVDLEFYGQPVTVRGTVTVLDLNDEQNPINGNYKITVTNIVDGELKEMTTTVEVTLPSGVEAGLIIGVVEGTIGLIELIVLVLVCLCYRRTTSGHRSHKRTVKETRMSTLSNPLEPAADETMMKHREKLPTSTGGANHNVSTGSERNDTTEKTAVLPNNPINCKTDGRDSSIEGAGLSPSPYERLDMSAIQPNQSMPEKAANPPAYEKLDFSL